ncbi:MAG: hypothetical protein ACPGWR_29525 [Ardenticatenaceae bacterium]
MVRVRAFRAKDRQDERGDWLTIGEPLLILGVAASFLSGLGQVTAQGTV